MTCSKTTFFASRKYQPKAPSAKSGFAEANTADDLVPLSCEVPRYVRVHLEKAAGIASLSAMARKVLTDWSEKNKATR